MSSHDEGEIVSEEKLYETAVCRALLDLESNGWRILEICGGAFNPAQIYFSRYGESTERAVKVITRRWHFGSGLVEPIDLVKLKKWSVANNFEFYLAPITFYNCNDSFNPRVTLPIRERSMVKLFYSGLQAINSLDVIRQFRFPTFDN